MGDWDIEKDYKPLIDGVDSCSDDSPIKTDGVVCGPVMRLKEVDYDDMVWRGSMLLVVRDAFDPSSPRAPKVEYNYTPSGESDISGSGSGSTFEGKLFHTDYFGDDNANHSIFQFYRYEIELPLGDVEHTCKYSINGETEPHFMFYVPAKTQNFNTIAYSCNGFSLAVDSTKFKGTLWYDILQKHSKVHYHVMLGGGDQLYSDAIKLYSPRVKKWVETNDPIKKRTMKVDDLFRREMGNFYLKEYLEWFGYGYWKGSTPKSRTLQRLFPVAMSTIPSVNIWDDHDTIDGFGSYPDRLMKTPVFSTLGNVSYKYYMLFQHHVSIDETQAHLKDKHWILSKNDGEFIKQKSHSVFTRIGPSIAMLGLDCRTERKLKSILPKSTYEVTFQRLNDEIKKKKFDHLYLMLGVPIAYPRLVILEYIFSSPLLYPIKYLSKKKVVAQGLVNEFNGDVELLDDLNDHWCAHDHKKERNNLIAALQDWGAKHGVRITILSGDVHLAAVGRFRSKLHRHHLITSQKDEKENEEILSNAEEDLRLMFNVISSAVVNTPPPDGMAKLLQSKNHIHKFDYETDEDSVPLFKTNPDQKTKRKEDCFLNSRNWSDLIPIENVLNNEYLNNNFKVEIGDHVLPGMVIDGQGFDVKNKDAKDMENPLYPVTEKGIMVTIHVEKDRKSAESESTFYSFPIPNLSKSSEKLSHKGAKHLLNPT
ncbi:Uncharacterized protein RNJ44_03433 [Nakaseomyces bracarensis]|uniref:PhoD-like phosphatase domain-containing protein n=1 Tax=Nakaseomyces bracarensis TaxID=273131 RepID=A0ABR4NXA4_9SACH